MSQNNKKARRRRLRPWVKVILVLAASMALLHIINEITEEQPVVLERVDIIPNHVEPPEPNHVEPMAYRMTYYYTGDGTGSGKCTASGVCTDKFQTNERGWYTYKGKLVMATAHRSLGKTTEKTYQLYDELVLNIEGKEYQAIVLDKCGACMRNTKIDLFVKDKSSGLDTKITVVKK